MVEKKLKVIVLYNRLWHYRIPVWNILAEKCDLTVAYTEGRENLPENHECKFKILYLPANTYLKYFVIQKDNIKELTKNYDVVLAYGGITWLKYVLLPLCHKHVVYHTIGVSASYRTKYDSSQKSLFLDKWMFSKANSVAFYTHYPIEKFAKLGIPKEKMFEAPNTVKVEPISEQTCKKSILFIGSLYKAKGIQYLLDSYLTLRDSCDLPVLNIIGTGPEYNEINAWIERHNLSDIIKLIGPVYSIQEKARFFADALACISPLQAGLTVLESMGYGVPFITTKDAYTGGERFNIHHMKDGILMDDVSELTSIIKDISKSHDKYVEMGIEAKRFYDKCRKPSDMAEGLWSAIKYAYEH